jgi:SAM-dependent methyltransferase
MSALPIEAWTAGSAYEPYVGRWSRSVARAFLDWLALPPDAVWLDVGCGTGSLSHTILERAAPRQVIGVDPSESFLAYARSRIDDPRIAFRTGDARALPMPEESVDAVVSGLVLNFVPEPETALGEMRRVARRGGAIALYVWDYAGEMQFMRRFWEAAAALDPAARVLDEGVRFPICAPEPLRRLFSGAGLDQIALRTIDIPTVFKDFDDYWSPFLGGQGPAPAYCMSLDDERRAVLRESLRASLPAEHDGSIRMTARAFAIRGTKPA